MFIFYLLYAGAAAVLSFVNMLSIAALVPVQVLELVNIPVFWFISGLIDLGIRPAPQALVQVASSSFFNSISAVPFDAHSVFVRRPAVVPSVIVPTTTALAVRPTIEVALVTVESESADICGWFPVGPIALSDVVTTPVASQVPSSSVTLSLSSSSSSTSTSTSTSESVSSALKSIVSRTSTSRVFFGTFATVLLATFVLAALSASCGWFERLSCRIRGSLVWFVAGLVGIESVVSMQVMDPKVDDVKQKKRTRRGGRHARSRKLREAAALQDNNGTTQATATLIQDIPQASQTSTAQAVQAKAAITSTQATQAAETSVVSKKRHSGGWRSKNARAKRKATYEAERQALAQLTATALPVTIDDVTEVQESSSSATVFPATVVDSAKSEESAPPTLSANLCVPVIHNLDVQEFPSLAISAASLTTKAHRRSLKADLPYTRKSAFQGHLDRILSPELRFTNEYPSLDCFVVSKARSLRPATFQRSIPVLAPLPFDNGDSMNHAFLAWWAQRYGRPLYAVVVSR
ncbi:hypothetical protein EUX98_g7011 [Antrodiella citrinella]|uniref:Uncharacterized protein n=1 Tax=Antrodiella citrinella TaxID=2447956 RepID=A0A4S4MMM7_9APHY|nr:hypothetical protein EUX98_g7011 [Antrodiella citrinella]